MDALWAARRLAHPRATHSDAVCSHNDGGRPVVAADERSWRGQWRRRPAEWPSGRRRRAPVCGAVRGGARAWPRRRSIRTPLGGRGGDGTSESVGHWPQGPLYRRPRVEAVGHAGRDGGGDLGSTRPRGRRRVLACPPSRCTGLEATNDADVAVAVFIVHRGGKKDARLALCAADCARVSLQWQPRCS